jgi:hypothetical protein
VQLPVPIVLNESHEQSALQTSPEDPLHHQILKTQQQMLLLEKAKAKNSNMYVTREDDTCTHSHAEKRGVYLHLHITLVLKHKSSTWTHNIRAVDIQFYDKTSI